MAILDSYGNKPLNFKKLYNKTYGEFVNKQHKMTPEQLFDLARKYFEWAEENSLTAGESASYQGHVTQSPVEKPRIFTLNGLFLFIGLSATGYSKMRNSPGFAEVTEFIDTVIHEQKFQLAANNMVNTQMIMKDIGLDKGAQINVNNNSTAGVAVADEEMMINAVKSVLDEL